MLIIDNHNYFLVDRPVWLGCVTRFVKDAIGASFNGDGNSATIECDVLHRVDTEKAGTVRVFFHDIMHETESPLTGFSVSRVLQK